MTDAQIADIIKASRREFLETQRKYVHRGEILALRADSTTLSLSDYGKVRELVAKGVEITKDYFVACEAIIFSLDSAARPMVETLSVRRVGEIADLLQEITEDMDGTTTSFNVSVNGQDRGAANLMPKPGILAKTTQLFWKNYFEAMPDHAAELERRAAEKNAQEQKTRQEKEQNQAAVQKAKTQLQGKQKDDSQAREQLQAKCDEALERFRAQTMGLTPETGDRLIDQYKAALKAHMDKAFTKKILEQTVQIGGKGVSPEDVVMDHLQQDVYHVIFYSDRWLSITDIILQGNLDKSAQRVGSAVRQLVEMGVIAKMEAYYALPGTPYTVKNQIWVENPAWSQKPLPTPPAIPAAPVTAAKAESKKSKKPLILVCILVVVALAVAAVLLFGGGSKTKQEEQVRALAQSAAQEVYNEKLLEAKLLQENGVTDISVTVEDVVLVRSKDLQYGGPDHYLVVLKIDCTAETLQPNQADDLCNYLGRALPDTAGEVDGYPVRFRAEFMAPDAKLFDGKAEDYSNKTMVYISINGTQEGTPSFYF